MCYCAVYIYSSAGSISLDSTFNAGEIFLLELKEQGRKGAVFYCFSPLMYRTVACLAPPPPLKPLSPGEKQRGLYILLEPMLRPQAGAWERAALCLGLGGGGGFVLQKTDHMKTRTRWKEEGKISRLDQEEGRPGLWGGWFCEHAPNWNVIHCST